MSTGLYTCKDEDECDATHRDYDTPTEWNVCHEQAVCVNNNAGYTCDCNEGYDSCADVNNGEIVGQCCADRDECSLDAPCATFADCTNRVIELNVLLGIDTNFICQCKAGFEPVSALDSDLYSEDGYVNIDECTANSHGCDANAECVDTAGNYI